MHEKVPIRHTPVQERAQHPGREDGPREADKEHLGAAVGSNDSAVVKDLLEPHVEVRVDDVHDEGDASFFRGVALGDEREDFFREDGG